MDKKENEMLNLTIASLISSDNNTTRKEITHNIERLESMMKSEDIKDNNFFKTKCKQGIRILKHDLSLLPEEEE